MGMLARSSFQDHFASLTDPRCPHAPPQRHQLSDMLVIAVCAVIWGADGQAQAAWFAQRLDVPHGMPGQDPFRRVLSRWDPEALTQCFLSWTAALRALSGGAIGSIDGTTLRHAFDPATSPAAMHRGRAWANAQRLGLGQGNVDDTSKELPALPQLFQRLDVAGATGPMDAMGGHKDIAPVITEQQADDVVALKDNPPTLYDDGTLFLDDAKASEVAEIDHAYHDTVDGDHGRLETRRYWLPSASEW